MKTQSCIDEINVLRCSDHWQTIRLCEKNIISANKDLSLSLYSRPKFCVLSSYYIKYSLHDVSIHFDSMGLLHSHSPLALTDIEEIHLGFYKKNLGFSDFINMYNSRLVYLNYLAWKYSHLSIGYESHAEDSMLSKLVQTISGAPVESCTTVNKIYGLSPSRFLAAFISCNSLQAILKKYFRFHFTVIEFEAHRQLINSSDRSALNDGQYNQLNHDLCLGKYVYNPQHGIKIIIESLTLEQYSQFFPDESHFIELKHIISAIVPATICVSLQPELSIKDDILLTLNSSFKLGWSTWLNNAALPRNQLIIGDINASH